HVIKLLSSFLSADCYILEDKPVRLAVVLSQLAKKKIDGLDKNAAPTLPADNQVVNRIAVHAIVRPDLHKKHVRFAADGFQDSILHRRVRLPKPAIDPLSSAVKRDVAQSLLDLLTRRFSNSSFSHKTSRHPR